MLGRFLESTNPSNIRELIFELIWDEYVDDDITSVMDIPAWEPIDGVLCALARRIQEVHPERKLRVVLIVVAPQSTDLGKVKFGSLFVKFREEGKIVLQYFIDYLPPVSLSLVFTGQELTFCFALRCRFLRYASVGTGRALIP